MVERTQLQPLPPGQVGVLGDLFRQGAVDFVLPDRGRPGLGEVGLAGEQTEPFQLRLIVALRRYGPLIADLALGQGAGLVGDQDVDVAEVLDAG